MDSLDSDSNIGNVGDFMAILDTYDWLHDEEQQSKPFVFFMCWNLIPTPFHEVTGTQSHSPLCQTG